MKEVPKHAKCESCRWYRAKDEKRVDHTAELQRGPRGNLIRPLITVRLNHGECLVSPPLPRRPRPQTHEDDVCRRWEPTFP